MIATTPANKIPVFTDFASVSEPFCILFCNSSPKTSPPIPAGIEENIKPKKNIVRIKESEWEDMETIIDSRATSITENIAVPTKAQDKPATKPEYLMFFSNVSFTT
jgi:hypothetical protein